MQIFITTVSGRVLVLEVAVDTTVKQLKQAIQVKNGILVHLQSLVYGAKPLVDEMTLGDYGVMENATVFLVLRLPGGC